jgi:tetratricopeptide (TPR) repeat protein
VGALIFGGNVAQGAAAGAAMGAASGAATGAVAGSMADSKAKDQQAKQRQIEELKEKIGDQNFEAANLLAHCKHRQAIETAQKAYSSTQNPDQRLYALYIQAVAAEESGDQKSASSAYDRAIQDDPSRGPAEKIRAKCLEGVMKAQKVRQDYGLPPLCK